MLWQACSSPLARQWSLLVAWEEMVVAGTHTVPESMLAEWLRTIALSVDGASVNTRKLHRIDMNLKQRVLVALHRYLRDGARMRGHMCVLGACACACKHGSTILADWTGYTPRSYM